MGQGRVAARQVRWSQETSQATPHVCAGVLEAVDAGSKAGCFSFMGYVASAIYSPRLMPSCVDDNPFVVIAVGLTRQSIP